MCVEWLVRDHYRKAVQEVMVFFLMLTFDWIGDWDHKSVCFALQHWAHSFILNLCIPYSFLTISVILGLCFTVDSMEPSGWCQPLYFIFLDCFRCHIPLPLRNLSKRRPDKNQNIWTFWMQLSVVIEVEKKWEICYFRMKMDLYVAPLYSINSLLLSTQKICRVTFLKVWTKDTLASIRQEQFS